MRFVPPCSVSGVSATLASLAAPPDNPGSGGAEQGGAGGAGGGDGRGGGDGGEDRAAHPLGLDTSALLASCASLAALPLDALQQADAEDTSRAPAGADAEGRRAGEGAARGGGRGRAAEDEILGSALFFGSAAAARISGQLLLVNSHASADEDDE